MRHAADQCLEAAVEIGFPERFPEHRYVRKPLFDRTVPGGDEGERYPVGFEPLRDPIDGFAAGQLHIEQRGIAGRGLDERERIADARGWAEHAAAVTANRILHFRGNKGIILSNEDREIPRTRAHGRLPSRPYFRASADEQSAGRCCFSERSRSTYFALGTRQSRVDSRVARTKLRPKTITSRCAFASRPTPPGHRPIDRRLRSGNAGRSVRPQRHANAQERIARISVLGSSRVAAEVTRLSRPDYYRQHAQECLRLANETLESSTKAVLIDMAQAWIKLADQAQRNRRFDLGQAVPVRPIPAGSHG